MLGFPVMFWVHFIAWPVGWIGITLIWSYFERKKEIKEDEWLAGEFKKGSL